MDGDLSDFSEPQLKALRLAREKAYYWSVSDVMKNIIDLFMPPYHFKKVIGNGTSLSFYLHE